MRRLWQLCFAIMVMTIDFAHVTSEPSELERLRKTLDMVDLTLASDILGLRRDLDTERRLRLELQTTVHQLQEQMIANNHTNSIDEIYNLRADIKTQQSIIENLQQEVHIAKYQNHISRKDNTRLQNENIDLRHNVIALNKAFVEEKHLRKQTEKRVRLMQTDLQLELRIGTDQGKELKQYKSSTEESLTSLRSELHEIKRKQNELNSSASTSRNLMDVYIDGVSIQVCQLNPSYVQVCQRHNINMSSCCLRIALQSVQETLKLNGLKLSDIEKHVNLRVSFSAHVSPSINHVYPSETIVFRTVVSNEGNAYNPTNGIFVAPVDGTYVFFSNILTSSRGFEAVLMINENKRLLLYSGEPYEYAPGSNMITIHMDKGDSARMVKHGIWGKEPFYVHNYFSTFSGFLLNAG